MSSSITIDGTTTEVYSSAEVKALFAGLGGTGHIDGFKYELRLPTYRIFSKSADGTAKVMFAPEGFTWAPGLTVASATTATVRRLYFDKATVDNLVAELSA